MWVSMLVLGSVLMSVSICIRFDLIEILEIKLELFIKFLLFISSSTLPKIKRRNCLKDAMLNLKFHSARCFLMSSWSLNFSENGRENGKI